MECLEQTIRKIVEAHLGNYRDQTLQRQPLPRRSAAACDKSFPARFPVPLAPKTRERIATRRYPGNGNASNFNRRRLEHCLDTAGATGSIPVAPTILFNDLGRIGDLGLR